MRLRGLAGILALLGAFTAGAQVPSPSPANAPQPGSEITVTLITVGLGQEVFERFGHNALWFHDSSTGEDVAYEWGLFSFLEPHFLARFLTGANRYWMGGRSPQSLVDSEHRAGRPITLQRLNLTPLQALRLRDFVRWNSQDEHKFYRYDYFQDNCSTRLRDALDMALGGVIKRATDSVKTETTFRRESVRLTDGDRPIQAGIDIALGRPADSRLTEWQTFFIPMHLRDALRTMRVPDAAGKEVPLVASERMIGVQDPAAEIPDLPAAPRLVIRYGLLGILLAAVVVGLRVLAVTRRSAVWGLALFGAGWSLVCGILGVILLMAWLFTKHVFWAYNENVLLLTPLSLALVILAPAALLSRRATGAARVVSFLIAASALVATLLAIIPGGQENRAIVAMILPVHVALALALGTQRAPLAARRT